MLCSDYFNKIIKYIEMSRVTDEQKQNITYLMDELEQIILVLLGNRKVINNMAENKKELILMNVYYRFYIPNWLEDLKSALNYEGDEDGLEPMMIRVIKETPFEFYQYLKGNSPDWFHFTIMDLLSQCNLLPGEKIESLGDQKPYDYFYTEFLNYLVHIDIDYFNFYNYSLLYTNNEYFIKYLDLVVGRNVQKSFKNYEKNPNVVTKKQLIDLLNRIIKDLNKMFQNTYAIADGVIKLSFEKFVEYEDYKTALELYMKIYERSRYRYLLEKLFAVLVLDDHLDKKFYSLAQLPIKKDLKDNNLIFILYLVKFYQAVTDNTTEEYSLDDLMVVKKFFNFCFVEDSCPIVMSMWTLRLIENLFQSKRIFINIFFCRLF